MGVPPLLVRRLVLAPLVLALEGAAVVASPLLILVAAVASPLTGGRRPLRMLAIVLAYAVRHLAATLACLGLWLRGEGGDRDAYYAVLRRFVAGFYRVVVRVARVRVEMIGSMDADTALERRDRPVIVFPIHAGHGDSFLVIWQLLCRYERAPRIVMHERLRLDPLIDVIGERLPNRFVDPRGGDTEKEIARMSADLDPKSAVLIFPEGGNFTAEHRQRGIERLEQLGHEEEAAWARSMERLSAPRPGGALAAMEAAPDADVVFVAHTGFPTTVGELWACLPHRQRVEIEMWRVPAADIPQDRDAQIDWLFGWWRRLDAWVGERP